MISELDRNLIALHTIADVLTKMAEDLKRDNDWDDVERYFEGPECQRCDYLRGHRDGEGLHTYCGLLAKWKGVGREPQPSDCRGLNRLED